MQITLFIFCMLVAVLSFMGLIAEPAAQVKLIYAAVTILAITGGIVVYAFL